MSNSVPVIIPSQLDPAFSGDGIQSTDFGNTVGETGRALAVMTDGRIVVAGTVNDDFSVARYLANGALDTTFSGSGKLTTNISGIDQALAVAVQPDGKIVVVGSSDDGSNLVMVRYTSNGNLDTSFNGTGIITTSIASSSATETNSTVLIQPNGAIVVAGTTDSTYLIQRYTSAGVLDTSFSGDGRDMANFTGTKYSEVFAMNRQADGKLLVAGRVYQGSSTYDSAITRYNADGTLDTRFNGTGTKVFDTGSSKESINDIQIQTDGKIVLAGTRGSTPVGLLVRLNADGSMDNSFSGDGIATFSSVGSSNVFNSVSVLGTGQLMVGGVSDSKDIVARFDTSGALDTTFNTTGYQVNTLGSIGRAIYDTTLTTDGKFIAVGEVSNNANRDFGVLQLGGGLSSQSLMASVGNTRPAGSPSDSINYSIPANAFFDADGDALTYSATLANGNSLPSWLSFHAGTRTFTGTPTASDFGGYEVKVTANDNQGGTASSNFMINVKDDFMNAIIEKEDGRWNASSAKGTPVEITYSFLTSGSGTSYSSSFQAMSDTQKAAVRLVLANYAAVSGLTFKEVSDGGNLRYGTVTGNPDWTGNANMPDPSAGGYSNVWFNRKYLDDNGVAIGSRPFNTMTHETGHALGFKHPGLKPGDGGPYLEDYGLADMRTNSTMSYVYRTDATIDDSTGKQIYPSTPMRWDVASIQYLYGVNSSYNAGDTAYDFDPVKPFFKNIWDGGGIDTINIASYIFDSTISLVPGTFSSLHTAASQASASTYWGNENLSISYNVIIENAIGGAGNDTITGNTANNNLTGGLGNDTFNGGAGMDTARYSGIKANYTLTKVSTTQWTVKDNRTSGNEGKDTLNDMELLAFADQTFDLTTGGSSPPATPTTPTTPTGLTATSGNDTLAGTGVDDVLKGLAGNDQLSGLASNDTLAGGIGNDVLEGGDGNDLLIGGQSDAGEWQVSQSSMGELMLRFTPNNVELAESSGLNLKGNFTLNTLPIADGRFTFVQGSAELREAISNLYLALTQRLPEVDELSQWSSMGFDPNALYEMAGNSLLGQIGSGASASQKSVYLFNTIWGTGVASSELLQIGTDFFNAGGSVGTAVRVLAQYSPLRQQLTDVNGDIRLTRTATLSDSGWGLGDGGDTLNAGAGNDILVGGGGNDTLNGGSGTDLAVWAGRVQDFKVTVVGTGTTAQVGLVDTRLGTTDLIDSIEQLSIGGQNFNATPLQSVEMVRSYLATHTDTHLEVVLMGVASSAAM